MDSKIVEIIGKYMRNFHFNYDGGFTEDDVEDFIWYIDRDSVPSFHYEAGASKLVLIPDEYDFVIKIPFTGAYAEVGEYYDDEQGEWVTSEDGGCYEDFYGSSDDSGCNYCAAECEIYEEAKDNGFEQLLLKIEKVGEFNGTPVYIQPKVKSFTYTGNTEKYSSNKSKEIVKEEKSKRKKDFGITICSFPTDWSASCLDILGSIDELNRFFEFLNEKSGDLHSNNIGYCNGKPCIIDYAGFWD